jgi:hypothetical protein
MLMDWQKQSCEKGYTTKSNLQTQCNAHLNSNVILCRNRKISPKIHMEEQNTLNSKNNPESKQQCWRCHNTRPQIILQSHRNKTTIVLAQKQT